MRVLKKRRSTVVSFLKKSLQRSDRRAGNAKANCGAGNAESKRVRSHTPTSRHASPSTSENMKGPFRSNRSRSPKEGSQSPELWRRRSAQRRQSEDGGASMSSEYEMYDDSSTTTVSQRSALRGKRAVGQMRKKPRGKRSASVGSKEVNTTEETNLEDSVPEGRSAKRPRKEETEENTEGSTSQNHPVLTTTYPYYTATGSCDTNWTLGETCIETEPVPDCNGDVLETPQWRVKVYTSLYSMEGTENLDDEVFLKRHHRLEVDERRRKRWDVQRIREQRHIDKLKQREASSNALGGSKGEDVEDPVCSLWPDPEDAQFLEVSDDLPVSAFGLPISKFTPSEFSLPWLQPGASDSRSAPKRRHGPRGRASGNTVRRRGVGRGGRRGDGAERK
ncbi:male-specific lethal 1-like 1 isoform X2 [Thrips palmi]|uniref:Male-specific lethal 1-like 1 isoform X2 n=1 Tax=Thrips palmi TaxID=161013 RepID=A0A6P8ZLN7_THRPL|nr:male-specific lethal 1-like 1 isoform X2 [Thrips palmi]